MNKPEFTVDWTTMHFPSWKKLVPNPEKVNSFLEIGNYEGRSILWWATYLENAELNTIDPSTDLERRQRLLRNISKHPRANKINLRFGLSDLELRRFGPNTMDVIYVDGSHEVKTVLSDALACYSILSLGGTLIFDDYAKEETDFDPYGLKIKVGLDAFLEVAQAKVVYKGYQLAVTK